MPRDENIVEWTRILRESRAYQSLLNTSAAYILNNTATKILFNSRNIFLQHRVEIFFKIIYFIRTFFIELN